MPGSEHDPDQDALRTAVGSALRLAPREHFLPEDQRGLAGADRPLPIGRGQTSSQPRTVVDMLLLLGPHPGMRVLDVGAGSGWTTALLAYLVGPTGSVLGLELEPDLASWGAQNVRAADVPWARLEQADPQVLGRPAEAPFDRVLVSAAPRRRDGDPRRRPDAAGHPHLGPAGRRATGRAARELPVRPVAVTRRPATAMMDP